MLVYAPLRGLRRPAIGAGMYFSVSHRPSIQHGRSAPSHRPRLFRPQGARFVRFLNSQWSSCCAWRLAILPCSLGLLRPVSATGGGLRAPLAPPAASRPSTAHFVCSALQPFGPSPFCKHLHPQFAIVDLHLRTVPLLAARCSVAAHCASLRVLATSTLRVSDARKLACSSPLCPQFAIVALLRYRLQVSFAHWTSASPVSRTARGEAPSPLGLLRPVSATGGGLRSPRKKYQK